MNKKSQFSTLDKYKSKVNGKPKDARKATVSVRPWRVSVGKKSVGFKVKVKF